MPTVTSQDGTKIAFDRVGSGPAVVLINGAMAYRAMDPTLGRLAELLSTDFSVYNFDRRGRGESGDTQPFAKTREIEDVQALIDDAGGQAALFGVSSGGAIALETAATTPGVTKVVVYEVPFIVDDSRRPVIDYEGHSKRLVAEGRLDELLNEYIPLVFGMLEEADSTAGHEQAMPEHDPNAEEQAQGEQDQAMMDALYAVLPTIPYDAAFVGEFMVGKPLPADHWADVTVPVLVADGGASPAWLRAAADALAEVLPNASRETLAGQTHMVEPEVLAPALLSFLGQEEQKP